MKYLLPVLPAVDLGEIVRPHQPDESDARQPAPQLAQCFGRIGGRQLGFDAGDSYARMPSHRPSPCQPLLERGHAGHRLQRVLRRYQPPDRVEPQPLQRQQADMPMPLMGWIERTPKQADHGMPLPPPLGSTVEWDLRRARRQLGAHEAAHAHAGFLPLLRNGAVTGRRCGDISGGVIGRRAIIRRTLPTVVRRVNTAGLDRADAAASLRDSI